MKTTKTVALILGSILATATVASADRAPTGPDLHARASGRTDVARDQGVSVEAIHFGFDSARLDAVDREQARAAARWLTEHPGHRIVLEGHADHTGPAAYNMHLANLRVRAVRAWMMKAGAAPDRIVVASYGEHLALSDNHDNQRQVTLYAERNTRPIARK